MPVARQQTIQQRDRYSNDPTREEYIQETIQDIKAGKYSSFRAAARIVIVWLWLWPEAKALAWLFLALASQNPRPKPTFLVLAWLDLALAQAKASSNKCDKWGLRVYAVKKGLENTITKVDAGLVDKY